MDSVERIKTVVKKRQKADRIPWSMNFGAYQCMTNSYIADYKRLRGIGGYICDYLDYDVQNVLAPEKTGQRGEAGGVGYLSNGIDPERYYTQRQLSIPGCFIDAWGHLNVPWESEPEYCNVYSPLLRAETLGEIEAYPFPKLDMDSAQAVKRDAEAIHARGKLASADCGGLFGASWYLRGMERLMTDLYDEPEFVTLLADRITESLIERVKVSADAGVDMFCFADDLGTQTAPQIAPEMWRSIYKPRWARVFDAVRSAAPEGMIFMHSCGMIEAFIPDFIDIGLDILHPIQPETMDVYRIGAEYQRDITIWGTISMQKTMPFGTPADVDAEVRERVQRLGNVGAFVISPSNVLSKDVPFENVDALIEACRKYC